MSFLKHKISSLNRSTAQLLYNSLLELNETTINEPEEFEKENQNEPAPEDVTLVLDTLLSLLGSELKGPESPIFEDSAQQKFTSTILIFLKPNIFWKISFLSRLRQALVHGLTYFSSVHLQCCHYTNGWFLAWVMKFQLQLPASQVFQAVCKMYMCAKFLQKKVLRGVLTNGRDWMFLLVKLDDNYDKAIFKQSFMMELTFKKSVDGTRETTGPWPDLIAGVLSYWIENSFVDLESDDWFEPHQAIDLSPWRAWS
ncbi:hypothetical protein BDR04DRAFT_1120995 [Suillus decipiens]|nr:hypothetical protein BDR04DRAFT_1120995 [Suillus decipiens]